MAVNGILGLKLAGLQTSGRFEMRRAHLVGVAGAGMRALADVLLGRGWQLSGSDREIASVRALAEAGVCIHEGHAAGNLPPDAQLVIHSDAVGAENPELRRAVELGIPTCSYFQMVGRLMLGRRGLAVAGTHGKSTTTAMAAQVLIQADADPTVLCGAAPLGRFSGGRAGRGEPVLVEACEYRANFLHLRPRHAVILGIEPDHFDCYGSREELEHAFSQFAKSVPPKGLILARHDCAATRRIVSGLACRVETFANDGSADWSARRLTPQQGRYRFEIRRHGKFVCEVNLQVPGRHNVSNALAAAALAWHNGAGSDGISRSLGGFRGLGRRFELLGVWGGVLLIDDYAHHPTEVAATLDTVRRLVPGRRVWCVFQPHQASRTARLLDELAASLQNADRVLVAEIFRAREGPHRPGEVTAAALARRIRLGGAVVPQAHTNEEIVRMLESHLALGDVLITMGAGDIRRVCDGIIGRFREDRAAG